MKDLNEKHLRAYISKVLLKCLEDFNIKYNIKRYFKKTIKILLKIITNIIYSITRDNTFFNDTLISNFV